MMKITGYQAAHAWGIYTLSNDRGEVDFIWPNKLATSLNLKDVLSNPQFDLNKPYIFNIAGIYNTKYEAQNAFSAYLRQYGMPSLNKTVRYNRYSQVQCNETGKIWRNATECAKEMGINGGQLSQHLRRNPGYRTISGLTFSNRIGPQSQVQPIQFPTPIPPAHIQTPPMQPPLPPTHDYFNPQQNSQIWQSDEED